MKKIIVFEIVNPVRQLGFRILFLSAIVVILCLVCLVILLFLPDEPNVYTDKAIWTGSELVDVRVYQWGQ